MSKDKKKHLSPKGEMVRANYKIEPGKPITKLEAKKFKLPEDKEACELLVAKALEFATKSTTKYKDKTIFWTTFDFKEIKNHPTQHGPDIDLKFNNINGYAELFEVAPLKGPHNTASRVHNVGTLADWIRRQVLIKQKKYENKSYKPIFLIMYWSDNAFLPDEKTLFHVARDLNIGIVSTFAGIFSVYFHGGVPIVYQLYPLNEFPINSNNVLLPFGNINMGKDIFEIRQSEIVNVVPETVEINDSEVSEDGSYKVNLRITSIISILVILYSFYVQAFVEKSLCRVCLVIIFVLLAQIAISSFYFNWGLNLPV
ncbi:MAG: hypothetical protein EOO07_29050, partial [Chitinophagaceae bacterium]